MTIERLAYRPLRKAGRLAPLITAIGVSLLIQNLALMLFGADPKVPPKFVEAVSIDLGGVTTDSTKVLIVVVAALSMGALHLFVQYTRPGRAMRAVSHSMPTSALMGINVNRTIALTFALGSAMAAIGGMLVSMDQPQLKPTMGTLIGLKAFVAAVLGGIGSLPGAALGGLVLGLSEALVSLQSTTWAEGVAFVILIVVLLVKPSGLLGSSGREKV